MLTASGMESGTPVAMRARIVAFIRERVQALDWPGRMRCTIH